MSSGSCTRGSGVAPRDLTVAGTDGARVDFGGTGLPGVDRDCGGHHGYVGDQSGSVQADSDRAGQQRADQRRRFDDRPHCQVQGATKPPSATRSARSTPASPRCGRTAEPAASASSRKDSLSRVINVSATTDGNLIDMVSTASNQVVTGGGAGAVSASSNDAVNGSRNCTRRRHSTAVALGSDRE